MTRETISSVADRPVALRTWLGFAALCLGMFMAILDIQIVATSLPEIQRALGLDADAMSWVQTAYLIAEVVAIPLTGMLTRIMTLRGLFVATLSLFTIASFGCAMSNGFAELIAWRIVQGFAGGTLIPSVFAAVFLMFPLRTQGVATTIAGVLAVLAPTVGPIVGGAITEALSWRWLFLINIVPGIVAVGLGWALLAREVGHRAILRRLDVVALVLMAVSLAALELGLKEAPKQGWTSVLVVGLFVLCLLALVLFVRRTLQADYPIVDLRALGDRRFAVGSALNFVLGMGLYGSVYLMPVFLAFVRGHGPLRIGEIMLVTGALQLLAAPIAVALEMRVDARLLTGIGFVVFASGLGVSTFATADTDFEGMVLPQVLRGAAIMFCLLPPTRMALGHLAPEQVADASGLFNLMRNLGGAIGLALIDTVIYGRAPVIGAALTERLAAGDVSAAAEVGIPAALFASRPPGPIDAGMQAMIQPLVEKAALVGSIGEAWAMLGLFTAAALVLLLLVPASRATGSAATH